MLPPSSPAASTGPAEERADRLIKTEANLLRLPLFALHTKGLKNLDGIECRGRIRRAGQVREYLLRITRNTASLYPGPLSRRIHFALLSIATGRGFPVQNPITWSWRDLCRRMGIAYGGKTTLAQLKAAIRSTHGIVLYTEEALFSRPAQRALPSQERGYHLYANFAFKNDPLPEGGRDGPQRCLVRRLVSRQPERPPFRPARLRLVAIARPAQSDRQPTV